MNTVLKQESVIHEKKRWKFFRFKKPKKGAFREVVGKLSHGLMMPIAVLPIAGLLLGIGAAIVNNTTNEGVKIFGSFLKNSGDFVFGNLPVLFAVAIAIAFTRDAGVAGLAAVISWACFCGMQNALMDPNFDAKDKLVSYDMLYWKKIDLSVFGTNMGIMSLQTSVFGGLIVGAIVAVLYNRFYQIQMPKILGFFSGTRFVPIISLIVMMPLAILFAMIWPGIGIGLYEIGKGLGTLSENGGANALIFGYIERALVPFGLHHAFYSPLWYTSAGGSMTEVSSVIPFIHDGNQVHAVIGVILNGKEIYLDNTITTPSWEEIIKLLNDDKFNRDEWAGDQRLWFALNSNLIGKQLILSGGAKYTIDFSTFAQNTQNVGSKVGAVALTDKEEAMTLWLNLKNGNSGESWDPEKFKVAFPGVNPGQYEQGKYPFMVFGLPAAAGAMIMAAPKKNRKMATSIIASAGLTAFLTGITEPIEFTFLFLAPWLFWGIHAVLCSLSFWAMSLGGANVGQTFSGGLIDLVLYGFVPDALGASVNSWIAVIIGLIFMPIYFSLFYFLIKRFDLKTPGRGDAKSLITKKEYLAAKDNKGNFTSTQVIAYKLISAFGGKENISSVNACITKLRVSVNDATKIDENLIKELGAAGTMKPSPTLIHAIFGVDSEPIKSQMNNIISNRIDVKGLEEYIRTHESDEFIAGPMVSETSHVIGDTSNLHEIIILSPMSGIVKNLNQVPDQVFAGKIMGDGLAILPDGNSVVSPFEKDVKVDVAFPTGHAYVLDIDGIKFMIHIGLETVTLNSNVSDPNNLIAFKPMVKAGDIIGSDKKIVDVDFNVIKNKNLNIITPMIVLNESLENYDISVIPSYDSYINEKQPLLKLTPKK